MHFEVSSMVPWRRLSSSLVNTFTINLSFSSTPEQASTTTSRWVTRPACTWRWRPTSTPKRSRGWARGSRSWTLTTRARCRSTSSWRCPSCSRIPWCRGSSTSSTRFQNQLLQKARPFCNTKISFFFRCKIVWHFWYNWKIVFFSGRQRWSRLQGIHSRC